MGNKSTICNHRELDIQRVRGINIMRYADHATSYSPFFAHIRCSKCGLDCYRVKYYVHSWWSNSPSDNGWEVWTPILKCETIPYNQNLF